MKWFKHLTESHTNFKHRKIILEYGMESYGVYWICVELVGQQGKKFYIKAEEDWKSALIDITKLTWEKLEKYLISFSKVNLICPKALKNGDLAIPKMKDYADEYSVRISRQYPDDVGVDKIRIEQIRTEYIRLKGYSLTNLSKNDYARLGKATKTLLERTKGDTNLVLRGLAWIAKQNYEWTLETLDKKWLDFMKPEKPEGAARRILPDIPQPPINEVERAKVAALIHDTTMKMKGVK